MNNNIPVNENISEDVLNLLTESERENLKYFNSKGIRIKDIKPTEEVEMLEDAVEGDESSEEDNDALDADFEGGDSTLSTKLNIPSSSNTTVLSEKNSDFSDLFEEF